MALLSTSTFIAVATAIQPDSPISSGVFGVAVGTLIARAGISLFTGFEVAFRPFRLCPFIFSASAALVAWWAWF